MLAIEGAVVDDRQISDEQRSGSCKPHSRILCSLC